MLVIVKRPTRADQEKNGFAQKQNIRVKSSMLIRGNLRKCLACGGIPKISPRKKMSGLHPINKDYPHKPECKNKF